MDGRDATCRLAPLLTPNEGTDQGARNMSATDADVAAVAAVAPRRRSAYAMVAYGQTASGRRQCCRIEQTSGRRATAAAVASIVRSSSSLPSRVLLVRTADRGRATAS